MAKTLGPIVPYVGGKTILARKLAPILPPHRVYVEAFFGGGSVFFAKPRAAVNVGNDLDKPLIRFYQKFSCKAIEGCGKVKNICTFAKTAMPNVRGGSSDVCEQFAARRFSYGGMQRHLNPVRCAEVDHVVQKRVRRDCKLYEEKLRGVKLLSQDFAKVTKKFDSKETLTYLDPPYDEAPAAVQGYRFTGVTPEQVCSVAKRTRGKVIVSYNDTPRVRRACKGLNLVKVQWPYSVIKDHPIRTELLYSNFPMKKTGLSGSGGIGSIRITAKDLKLALEE